MKQSRFIQEAKMKYGLDFELFWRDGMRAADGRYAERVCSDQAESLFWESLAPNYDQRSTLFDYAPKTIDTIQRLLGDNINSLIEIGPGTGRFTLPMAKKVSRLTAIDFSEHMLSRLDYKLRESGIRNVRCIHGKWEDTLVEPADGVVAVNAIYRMWDIRLSIRKMNKAAKKRVVLVWTQQRSIFDDLYKKVNWNGCGTKLDYMYLLPLLYEMGIDANVEWMKVDRPTRFNNEIELRDSLYSQLPEQYWEKPEVLRYLQDHVIEQKGCLYFKSHPRIVFISWTPE